MLNPSVSGAIGGKSCEDFALRVAYGDRRVFRYSAATKAKVSFVEKSMRSAYRMRTQRRPFLTTGISPDAIHPSMERSETDSRRAAS